AEHHRTLPLPAVVIKLPIQEGTEGRLPAEGHRLGRRSTAILEPEFGSRGLAPGTLHVLLDEARVPLPGCLPFAELPAGRLETELHRRVGGIKRAERRQPVANLQAAAEPLTRVLLAAQQDQVSLLLDAAVLGQPA